MGEPSGNSSSCSWPRLGSRPHSQWRPFAADGSSCIRVAPLSHSSASGSCRLVSQIFLIGEAAQKFASFFSVSRGGLYFSSLGTQKRPDSPTLTACELVDATGTTCVTIIFLSTHDHNRGRPPMVTVWVWCLTSSAAHHNGRPSCCHSANFKPAAATTRTSSEQQTAERARVCSCGSHTTTSASRRILPCVDSSLCRLA